MRKNENYRIYTVKTPNPYPHSAAKYKGNVGFNCFISRNSFKRNLLQVFLNKEII